MSSRFPADSLAGSGETKKFGYSKARKVKQDRLKKFRRYDVSLDDLPTNRRARAAAPERGKYSSAINTLGLVAAAMSAVLVALVVVAIDKNREVRDSGSTIVDNFVTTNEMFDTRADMKAPHRAREQLAELAGILASLDRAAKRNATRVERMLPDMRRLLSAGGQDLEIISQVRGVTAELAISSTKIGEVANKAGSTVAAIDVSLGQAVELVNQLNSQLQRTVDKLRPIPAQDNLIPRQVGPK